MGLLLTEHPKNIKPGPGYTGYYLQDHMFYVGDHNVFPYLDKDASITRDNILTAIEDVARACDSYDKVIVFYTSYGALSGGTSYFDVNNDNAITITAGVPDDIDADMLDDYLDIIECKDMIIWLQPSYSGNWINPLKQESGPPVVPEKNRVILTSERAGNTAEFDLCNKESGVGSSKWYVDYLMTSSDKETFIPPPEPPSWKYVVTDKANSVQDKIYEIDKENDDVFDFYENPFDNGCEFVSGLTEAFYIDRDYYYGSSSHHESNGYLDADDDDAHNDPENTQGDQNNYISCKEAHYSMLNWHLNYNLGSTIRTGVPNPWYDVPQKEFTWLEEGTVYIF